MSSSPVNKQYGNQLKKKEVDRDRSALVGLCLYSQWPLRPCKEREREREGEETHTRPPPPQKKESSFVPFGSKIAHPHTGPPKNPLPFVYDMVSDRSSIAENWNDRCGLQGALVLV